MTVLMNRTDLPVAGQAKTAPPLCSIHDRAQFFCMSGPRPKRVPPGERRAQNKFEKRERIRAAAEQLFLKRGYDATTTREVAQRARVASGTVFLYAHDKRDLLFLVMHERLRSTVDEAFATLPRRAGLVDGWMHLFSAIYAMYGRLEPLAAPFVRELPGATGAHAAVVNGLTRAVLERLAVQVQEAQQRGEVRADVEPLTAAHAAFGLYFTALFGWLNGLASLADAPLLLRASLDLLFRGLRK